MDFTRLIENGTYSKENLKPKQQAFISGMEYAIEIVDTYKSNYDIYLHNDIPMFAELTEQIANKLLDGLKDYIQSDINESIVSFEDNNEVE